MGMLQKVGRNIRFLRESKELSQEELANIAGLHRSYIGHVERGEGNVTLSNLCRIAAALQVHPGALLFENTFNWKLGADDL
jgi:transcriptional regulator with XRE-family HTH domain